MTRIDLSPPPHARGASAPGANLRWAMLRVIFLTRTSLGFQFQSIAALTSFLVPAFALSYAEVGLLMGLFMLPGVVIAVPGGLLGQRFGSLRVVVAGLGLMIVGGMIVSYSAGLHTAAVGRAIGGVGGVLVNIMLARMVADWFRERELQTAMGLMLSAWPFGMALALVDPGPAGRGHLVAHRRVRHGRRRGPGAGPDRARLQGRARRAGRPGRAPRPSRPGSTWACPGACGPWRSAPASAGPCSTPA